MKRLCVLLLPFFFTTGIYAQELDSLLSIFENQKRFSYDYTSDNSGTLSTEPGSNHSANQDHTYVNHEFALNNESLLPEKEYHTERYTKSNKSRMRSSTSGKFKGHWAGFEWGLNNHLDDEFTVSREAPDEFMDLHTGRSWVVNINFAQYSLGFGTSLAGMVTGMGIEFNNYFFDNDITIDEVNDEITVVDLSDQNITKSKLATAFLRVPLILEVQFPGVSRSKRAFISAGVVGGLKLSAHTKVVYKVDDDKEKEKNRDDFNISPFRYGITARVGCGNTNVFFDYYFTPMFTKGKGPELYPFSIGLSVTF